jgi:N-acetylmuramoyl-L-alanine amidase
MVLTKKIVLFFLQLLLLFSSSLFGQNSKSIKTIIVDAGHGGKDYGAYGGYEGGLGSYEKNVTLAISNRLVAELRKQLPDVKIVPTRTTDIYQSPPEKANIANDNRGDLFVCIHADAVDLKTGRTQTGTRQETRYHVKKTGKGRKKKKTSTPYTVTVPVYDYYKIGSQRTGTSIYLFAAHKTSDKIKALMNSEEEMNVEASSDSTYNSIDFSAPEYRMMAKVHADRYQKKSIRLATLVDEEVDKTDRNALGINQRQKGIWVLQATNMPAILIETGFITNHDDERYLNSEKGQQELAERIAMAIKRYKEQIDNNTLTPIATGTSSSIINNEEKKVLNEATGQKYLSRTSTILKKVEVSQANFKVDLYDDGDIDGDIVSVYYNGKMIVDSKKLTDKPITLSLTTETGRTENELLIYADNVGEIPPNTALMIVEEGKQRTEVRISADSKKNGVIIFSKK